ALRDAVVAAAALPAEPPRRGGPARTAVLAVGVAVVVVAVLVGGYVVTWDSGSSSAPETSTQERAAAAFADSLVETDTVSRAQADCVAARFVDEVGFETLVAAGFFDEEGRFLDPDLAEQQAVRRALRSAALDCAG
ncbi:MAG: hypothetical protein WBP61_07230, partial [Nocardioides sp.]